LFGLRGVVVFDNRAAVISSDICCMEYSPKWLDITSQVGRHAPC